MQPWQTMVMIWPANLLVLVFSANKSIELQTPMGPLGVQKWASKKGLSTGMHHIVWDVETI